MSNATETYYLIDQYLKGELSEKEATQVADKIANDPSFAAEVEEQQMVYDVINGASIAELRAQMQSDIQAIDSRSGNGKRYYLLGAAAIAILSLSILFWPDAQPEQALAPPEEKTEAIEKTSAKESTVEEEMPSTVPAKTTEADHSVEEAPVVKEIRGTTLPHTVTAPLDTLAIKKAVEKHEEVKQKTSPTTVEDICKKTVLNVQSTIKDACTAMNNGEIIITNITGGEAPYAVYDKNSSAIIKNNRYSELKGGKYELYVIDANSCIHEYDYFVPSKNCNSQSYVINPTAQQGWKIPTQEGHITVYGAGGKVVFEKLPQVKLREWMGTDKNGNPLATGVYIYKIDYPDGTMATGEINIMQ